MQDEELNRVVKAAAQGDRDAQQELLEAMWPVIGKTVRSRKNRLGPSRDATQDMQQSAAMRVLRELPRHRWQGVGAFVAWVKTLARVEVVDSYRHHRAQKRNMGAESGDAVQDLAAPLRSAESRLDDAFQLQALLTRIRGLREEHGAAILMQQFGFSYAEIAARLGCSPEAARKLVQRAQARLTRKR